MKLQLLASAALVLLSAVPGVVAVSEHDMEESDKCDYDQIFRNQGNRFTRERMTRSAENGSLKQDYPDTWHDTKQARNQCKKQVGANECRDMGLCFEDEDDFDSYDDVDNLNGEDEEFNSEDEEEYEEPASELASSDPCSYYRMFPGRAYRSTRNGIRRSAENGSLKQDYPDAWHDSKQARNRCKKEVGPNECRNMGLCFEDEEEDDFDSYDDVDNLNGEDEEFNSEDEEEYEEPASELASSDPCSYYRMFPGRAYRSTRNGIRRSAENGSLKQDYPDAWHDSKQARNRCKKEVGPNECRNMGLCFEDEEEDDFDSYDDVDKLHDEDEESNSEDEEEYEILDKSPKHLRYPHAEPASELASSNPCAYFRMFPGRNRSARASMRRSAENGSLKQDYPEEWHDSRQARNMCKKDVGPNECRNMGLCGEEEDDLEDLAVY
eukprot:CAMPEP_0172327960 /NCGR_PEP_ID=MMETSP1058-20130122/60104_1 /TAXON_ID=83371 /ORGANISM="Detonula confervacea, Strain CCMP 353" /LENGTH=436 /DNA_ID=CAMNT_0013045053 /DNA_START=33 /DNA_END=1343 /DNA_ORIENTATION=-